MGATHAVQTAEEGIALAQQNPAGGADVAIVTVDVVNEGWSRPQRWRCARRARSCITGLANPEALTVHLSGTDMLLNRKHVKGSLFGDCNPAYDIMKMLQLYRAGKLKLDELVTKQYKLSEINEGYADLEAGKNIRGVIIHEH